MVWRRSQSFSPIPPRVQPTTPGSLAMAIPAPTPHPPTPTPTPAFTPSASRPLVPAAPTAFPLPTTSRPPIHRHHDVVGKGKAVGAAGTNGREADGVKAGVGEIGKA